MHLHHCNNCSSTHSAQHLAHAVQLQHPLKALAKPIGPKDEICWLCPCLFSYACSVGLPPAFSRSHRAPALYHTWYFGSQLSVEVLCRGVYNGAWSLFNYKSKWFRETQWQLVFKEVAWKPKSALFLQG